MPDQNEMPTEPSWEERQAAIQQHATTCMRIVEVIRQSQPLLIEAVVQKLRADDAEAKLADVTQSNEALQEATKQPHMTPRYKSPANVNAAADVLKAIDKTGNIADVPRDTEAPDGPA